MPDKWVMDNLWLQVMGRQFDCSPVFADFRLYDECPSASYTSTWIDE